jgi:hypothetical protein
MLALPLAWEKCQFGKTPSKRAVFHDRKVTAKAPKRAALQPLAEANQQQEIQQ